FGHHLAGGCQEDRPQTVPGYLFRWLNGPNGEVPRNRGIVGGRGTGRAKERDRSSSQGKEETLMISALTGLLLAISGSLIASIVVKITVTVCLALIGTWVASRSRAAVRHSLLMAAFGVLLLLPLASIVAPPIRIA